MAKRPPKTDAERQRASRIKKALKEGPHLVDSKDLLWFEEYVDSLEDEEDPLERSLGLHQAFTVKMAEVFLRRVTDREKNEVAFFEAQVKHDDNKEKRDNERVRLIFDAQHSANRLVLDQARRQDEEITALRAERKELYEERVTYLKALKEMLLATPETWDQKVEAVLKIIEKGAPKVAAGVLGLFDFRQSLIDKITAMRQGQVVAPASAPSSAPTAPPATPTAPTAPPPPARAPSSPPLPPPEILPPK